ncbi:hypothetical protein [Agitococcus lubricus]|uniref:START domain-containing protein n=1 Tax=Agitococcus lubricus TaxID=1077255 RepID=A0A2T5IZR7_9GAMM|nr:hypothetical protein [Agitococcus lubricus]PTQ89532.1 hypothetical protein C8N29_10663 [Agitococcus lubricus]
MLKKWGIISVMLLSSLSAGTYAANDDLSELRDTNPDEWQLVKNDARRDIKTYSKREDGKRIRSFKVDMIVDAPLEAVARLHFDYENYPRWYFKARQSRLLKKVSPTELYYYQVFSAPYGLPDRDVILHNVIEPYTPQKGFLRFNITAVPNFMPEQPTLVRILAMNMTVTFTPLGGGKTRLESEGYLDPGGLAPAWATNYVQRNAPYAVMLGVQRMVQSDDYLNSKLPMPFKYKE